MTTSAKPFAWPSIANHDMGSFVFPVGFVPTGAAHTVFK